MRYTYRDFNKTDRKQFEPLVEKAVKNEIAQFLNEQFPVYESILETDHDDIRVPYWKLNDSFKDFSKYLTRTYDGYRHSDLPMMVAGWLHRSILTMGDIADFSADGKSKLEEMIRMIASWNEE